MSLSDVIRNITKTITDRDQLKEKAKDLPLFVVQTTLSAAGQALLLVDRVKNSIKGLGAKEETEEDFDSRPAAAQVATPAVEEEKAARKEPVIFAPRPASSGTAEANGTNGSGKAKPEPVIFTPAKPKAAPESPEPAESVGSASTETAATGERDTIAEAAAAATAETATAPEPATAAEPTVASEPVVAPEPVAAPEPPAASAEPVASEPITMEPAPAEPVTNEPAPAEALTSEPAPAEAVTSEPATAEAVTTEPVAAEAAAAPKARPKRASKPKAAPKAKKAAEAPAEPATEPAAAVEAGTGAGDASGLVEPLPGYSGLTVASLRARMRGKSAEQMGDLLAYEQATTARPEVIRMYENRLAKLQAPE